MVMMGMEFMQMSFKERIIIISILSGILLIALVVDRINKKRGR